MPTDSEEKMRGKLMLVREKVDWIAYPQGIETEHSEGTKSRGIYRNRE